MNKTELTKISSEKSELTKKDATSCVRCDNKCTS